MSGWRRTALELFPDDAAAIAQENESGVISLLSDKLVRSLQAAEYETAKRIVKFALWLSPHSKREESFVHSLHDLLKDSITRPTLRSELWKVISASEFSILGPVFSHVLQRDAL